MKLQKEFSSTVNLLFLLLFNPSNKKYFENVTKCKLNPLLLHFIPSLTSIFFGGFDDNTFPIFLLSSQASFNLSLKTEFEKSLDNQINVFDT